MSGERFGASDSAVGLMLNVCSSKLNSLRAATDNAYPATF
jgi:hypothetical protein